MPCPLKSKPSPRRNYAVKMNNTNTPSPLIMCHWTITRHHTCNHRTRRWTPCSTPNLCSNSSQSRPSRTENSIKTLFRREPPPPSYFPTTQPDCHRIIGSRCAACVRKEAFSHSSKQKSSRENADARGVPASRGVERENTCRTAEKQHQSRERRARFRCSKCCDEDRCPTALQRFANGGLCCAGGVDEYEAQCDGILHSAGIFGEGGREEVAGIVEGEEKVVRKMNSTEVARWGATKGGKRCLVPMSTALEPEMVAEFINMSGTTVASLPPPEPSAGSWLPGVGKAGRREDMPRYHSSPFEVPNEKLPQPALREKFRGSHQLKKPGLSMPLRQKWSWEEHAREDGAYITDSFRRARGDALTLKIDETIKLWNEAALPSTAGTLRRTQATRRGRGRGQGRGSGRRYP